MRLPLAGLSVAVTALILAAPLAAQSRQAAGKSPRVGVLAFTQMTEALQDGFRQGLRDHGYVEGQNIFVEWRSAEGKTERANALAAELVRLRVDVIVAMFTPAVQAAKNATQMIPIVMAPAGDPVGTGLVASLAHPGSNITGISNIAAELSGKRLDLLREIAPRLTRVGLLIHGADPLDKAFVDETRTAAARAGLQLHVGSVRRPEDFDAALSAMTKERVGAVLVQGNLPVPASKIAERAVRLRLPSISPLKEFAEAGGLMSYGANLAEIHRRAASYVGRILKGAQPADLPVEQPTKFELIINLRTAKVIGLTVPPALLRRADQLIE